MPAAIGASPIAAISPGMAAVRPGMAAAAEVSAAAAAHVAATAAAVLRPRAGRHRGRHREGAGEEGEFSNQGRTFHNVTKSGSNKPLQRATYYRVDRKERTLFTVPAYYLRLCGGASVQPGGMAWHARPAALDSPDPQPSHRPDDGDPHGGRSDAAQLENQWHVGWEGKLYDLARRVAAVLPFVVGGGHEVRARHHIDPHRHIGGHPVAAGHGHREGSTRPSSFPRLEMPSQERSGMPPGSREGVARGRRGPSQCQGARRRPSPPRPGKLPRRTAPAPASTSHLYLAHGSAATAFCCASARSGVTSISAAAAQVSDRIVQSPWNDGQITAARILHCRLSLTPGAEVLRFPPRCDKSSVRAVDHGEGAPWAIHGIQPDTVPAAVAKVAAFWPALRWPCWLPAARPASLRPASRAVDGQSTDLRHVAP